MTVTPAPGDWQRDWIVKITEWSGGKDREPDYYGPLDLDGAHELEARAHREAKGRIQVEVIGLQDAEDFRLCT